MELEEEAAPRSVSKTKHSYFCTMILHVLVVHPPLHDLILLQVQV